MKNFKLLDVIIVLLVILALVVGLLTFMHFRQTADKQVEKTSKIAFQVFLRGVTITTGVTPIRVGDTTFISIRNVPYTDLKIVDVKSDTKKIVMPNPAKKPAFILVDDYSQIFMYDIIVTVIDTAKLTKDGAVVGGNKIKIGLPITLEGMDYKLNGTVSNVTPLTDEQAQQIEAEAAKAALKQAQQLQQAQAAAGQKVNVSSQPAQQPMPVSVQK